MLRVDRLTKWRMTSGSASSGRGGDSELSWAAGINSSRALAGTSLAGNTQPRRPAWLSSKSDFVANKFRMHPSSDLSSRERRSESVDLLSSPLLSDRDENPVLDSRIRGRSESRKRRSQIESHLPCSREHAFHIGRTRQHKLLEKCAAGKRECQSGNRRK